MGTSGPYSGGGGAAGNALREELNDWLDSLPDTPPPDQSDGIPPDDDQQDQQADRPTLPPESLLNVLPLLRPSGRGSADGPGGGGGAGSAGRGSGGAFAGGAQRSARASSTAAGPRGGGSLCPCASAMRKPSNGWDSILSLSAAATTRSTLPVRLLTPHAKVHCRTAPLKEDERRYVASEVTIWVLEENEGGAPPTPEEIVQKSIAVIISEAAQNETVEMIRRGERPEWASLEAERQLRDAAHVLARRVEVSTAGMTDQDFARAIEEGTETLRRIRGNG